MVATATTIRWQLEVSGQMTVFSARHSLLGDARTIRAEWMRMMGFSEADIHDACDPQGVYLMEEELQSLAAAKRMQERWTR
jgi:hypothetical protein